MIEDIEKELIDYQAIDAEPWEIYKKEMIKKYQELSGKTLSEASPETIIFNTISYMLALRDEKHNDDIKQNYLRFARELRLDLKGELYGSRGERLGEQAARATVRFYISDIQVTNILIPKGTRLQYNNLYFSTIEELEIQKGKLYVEGIIECNTEGTEANGIPIGQLRTLVDVFPHFDKAENITATNGGSIIESDESYKGRLREVPESFSTAGPDGAYIFWAKTAHQNIIDVAVITPAPTKVDIYLWTSEGKATKEIKDQVEEIVNDRKVRPLTDNVEIKDPTIKEYNLKFDWYLNKEDESLSETIKMNVLNEIEDFISWQKAKMGRDLNPDELIKKVKLAGVKRIANLSINYEKLEFNEIAVINFKAEDINYIGAEEE